MDICCDEDDDEGDCGMRGTVDRFSALILIAMRRRRGGLGVVARCLLALEHLLDVGSRERLGALEGHAEGTVPDELGGDTEGTRDTEEDGVEVLLVEAVVGEEDTRVGVDVGPGV